MRRLSVLGLPIRTHRVIPTATQGAHCARHTDHEITAGPLSERTRASHKATGQRIDFVFASATAWQRRQGGLTVISAAPEDIGASMSSRPNVAPTHSQCRQRRSCRQRCEPRVFALTRGSAAEALAPVSCKCKRRRGCRTYRHIAISKYLADTPFAFGSLTNEQICDIPHFNRMTMLT